MNAMPVDYQVIVAGAGPVGLTLAIDLGRRGIETLLVERDPGTKSYPKMDRTNARSMELCTLPLEPYRRRTTWNRSWFRWRARPRTSPSASAASWWVSTRTTTG